MTVVSPGPNASDLLSLMEAGLLDLLKAEITCSLSMQRIYPKTEAARWPATTHIARRGFFLPYA